MPSQVKKRVSKNLKNLEAFASDLERGVLDLRPANGRLQSIRGRIVIFYLRSLIIKDTLSSEEAALLKILGLENEKSNLTVLQKLYDLGAKKATESALVKLFAFFNDIFAEVSTEGLRVQQKNASYTDLPKDPVDEWQKITIATLDAEVAVPRLLDKKELDQALDHLNQFHTLDNFQRVFNSNVASIELYSGKVNVIQEKLRENEHQLLKVENRVLLKYLIVEGDLSIFHAIFNQLSPIIKSELLSGENLKETNLSRGMGVNFAPLGFDSPALRSGLIDLAVNLNAERLTSIFRALGREAKIKPIHLAAAIGNILGVKRRVRESAAKKFLLLEKDEDGVTALENFTYAPNIPQVLTTLKKIAKLSAVEGYEDREEEFQALVKKAIEDLESRKKIQSSETKSCIKMTYIDHVVIADEDRGSLHAKVFNGDLKAVQEELSQLKGEESVYKALSSKLYGANVLYFVLFSKSKNRGKVLEELLSPLHSYDFLSELIRDLDRGHWNCVEVIFKRNFVDLWGPLIRSFKSDEAKLRFLLAGSQSITPIVKLLTYPKYADLFLKRTLVSFASERYKCEFLTYRMPEGFTIFDELFEQTSALIDILTSVSESSSELLFESMDPQSRVSYLLLLANDVVHEDICSCYHERFFNVSILLPNYLRLRLLNMSYDESLRSSNNPVAQNAENIFPITPFECLLNHSGRILDVIELIRGFKSEQRAELLDRKNKDGLTPLMRAIHDGDHYALYASLVLDLVPIRKEMIAKIGLNGMNALEYALKLGNYGAISIIGQMTTDL